MIVSLRTVIPIVTLAALPFLIGAGCMPAPSDRRLKRAIERVGELKGGIGLYRYRYLWSDERYVGVLAQEVAEARPDAVVLGSDGFLRVDYRRLGTRLLTERAFRAAA